MDRVDIRKGDGHYIAWEYIKSVRWLVIVKVQANRLQIVSIIKIASLNNVIHIFAK